MVLYRGPIGGKVKNNEKKVYILNVKYEFRCCISVMRMI